jgi:hypothetical protein
MRTGKYFMPLLFFFWAILLSVTIAQTWPEDDAGDRYYERKGVMDGNNVRMQFRNTTELSDWGEGTDPYAHKWPNDFSGSKMTQGIAFMVGARVYIADKSTPVTDLAQIQTRTDLDTLFFCQTSYREEQDLDPMGQFEWNFYPCRGYSNITESDLPPALSTRPETWPLEGWPTTGTEKKWPGQWFGRRGPGKTNADMECYFVVNDAQDQEYLTADSPVKYFPRPGHFIGDSDPFVTSQRGLPWGGLGIRGVVRGYQWDNPLARDMIIWEYNITNISAYDIPDMAFGFWVNCGIGNDANDEFSFYDQGTDLIYAWDQNGIGTGGLRTGAMGLALPETPGIHNDGIDNDFDGLTDERRDNQAVAMVGPLDGISNLDNFLNYYHLQQSDLYAHWDADEDQDWRDGIDLNGNGRYDVGEFAGDDVGLDGIAPGEPGYNGPDAGECNHKPDFIPGQGCEPNFAALDVDESDMIGLTSFKPFPSPDHIPPYEHWFRNDKSMWTLLGDDVIEPTLNRICNLILTFASGVFTLPQSESRSISMAILHSWDPLEGYPPDIQNAHSLYNQKLTVQFIAGADYTCDFTKATPPAQPTIHAEKVEKAIKITWDQNAELNTREPLLQNRNDFEGYKLFKQYQYYAGSAQWTAPAQLLLQCDLADGITGSFPQEENYKLGNDSGLAHEYIDNDIYEGSVYKYTIVAYDYGIPSGTLTSPGMNDFYFPPYESNDEAIVDIPFPDAVDYPVEVVETKIIGSGTVVPEVVNIAQTKSKHRYVVRFQNEEIKSVRDFPAGGSYTASGINVHDVTDGNRRLAYEDIGISPSSIVGWSDSTLSRYILYGSDQLTSSFDGVRLKIFTETELAQFDPLHSGWLQGASPMHVTLTPDESELFPWDYEIVFTDQANAYSSAFNISKSWRVRDEYGILITENMLSNLNFNFFIRNTTFGDSFEGEPLQVEMIVQDVNKNGVFDIMKDRIFAGYFSNGKTPRWAGTIFILDFSQLNDESELPKPGDVYQIKYKRPFWRQDSLVFVVDPQGIWVENKDVVPNRMELLPNYPNPFNPQTTIAYSVSRPVQVKIAVYNVLGQQVATLIDKFQEPGNYRVLFDSKSFSAGLYFYSYKAGSFRQVRKMIVVK